MKKRLLLLSLALLNFGAFAQTTVVGNGLTAYAGTSLAQISGLATISCWGDSLIAGSGGTAPCLQLGTLYANEFTVNNQGIGGQTSTQIKTRMLAAGGNYNDTTIIWAGRNNFSSPNTVKADIAAMVAALTAPRRFLVLSILGASDDVAGSASTISQLNADLAAIYPANFADVCGASVLNCSAGVADASLRSDNVHLTTAGYGLVAAAAKVAIDGQIPYMNAVLTSRNIIDLLTSPPVALGVASPVVVYAKGNAAGMAASVLRDPGVSAVGGAFRMQKADGTDQWACGLRPAGGALGSSFNCAFWNGSAWVDAFNFASTGDLNLVRASFPPAIGNPQTSGAGAGVRLFAGSNVLTIPTDGGLRFANLAQPTCDANHSGVINYTLGNSSTKDQLAVCAHDASNAYAWRTIY